MCKIEIAKLEKKEVILCTYKIVVRKTSNALHPVVLNNYYVDCSNIFDTVLLCRVVFVNLGCAA